MNRQMHKIATNIRRNILRIANSSKGPHVGSALSCIDILATLYFKVLNIPSFRDKNRDVFIMSKGHGAMALYAVLLEKGFLSEEAFSSYYQNDGKLPAHLDKNTCEAIEVSSGSLGHGLPMALGFAYSLKLRGARSKVFVLMGDGECQEGSVWEAAMLAPKIGLDNLVVLIDKNNLQGYGRPTELVSFESLEEKFRSFNWSACSVGGHDYAEIAKACAEVSDRPKAIICETVKGKGVSFMEDELKWHYFMVGDEIYAKAIEELGA